MKDFTSVLSDFFPGGRLLLKEPLAKYTSLRLGGPADYFLKVGRGDELQKAVSQAHLYKIPFFILGGGTNVLFKDEGFPGLVIKNEMSDIKLIGLRGESLKDGKAGTAINTVYLEVESGVGVNRLVRYSLDQGLSGLEYFLGQPGTVGGAVWINAHNMVKKRFFGEIVVAATLFNIEKGINKVAQDYFRFGYDKSNLQKTGEIVLSAVCSFRRGNKEKLWKIARETLEYRSRTQPSGYFSAGCIFRNIKKSEAMRLATPQFTLSAGFLIESVGLKGKTIGGASFSPTHANFIVHKGQAKSLDVLKLIDLAREKVFAKYHLRLETEIRIVN